MTLEKSYKILKEFKRQQICNNNHCQCDQIDPEELTKAIDFILLYVEQDLVNDL